MRTSKLLLLSCLLAALQTACAAAEPKISSKRVPASAPSTDSPVNHDEPQGSWVAPDPATIPPGVNPYLDEVRRHRAAFRAKNLRDYVFVLSQYRMAMTLNQFAMRIVVKDGKAISARSLRWGGVAPAPIPTMDDLFADAEIVASLGVNHQPYRFHAEYDARFDHVVVVDAVARNDISDTENRFEVACFSLDSTGCSPVFLSHEQCVSAGGSTIPAGGNVDCDGGWSVGLIGSANAGATEVCCRKYTNQGADQLTEAQCAAVGGVEGPCGVDTLSVGSSEQRGVGCCRTFVR